MGRVYDLGALRADPCWKTVCARGLLASRYVGFSELTIKEQKSALSSLGKGWINKKMSLAGGYLWWMKNSSHQLVEIKGSISFLWVNILLRDLLNYLLNLHKCKKLQNVHKVLNNGGNLKKILQVLLTKFLANNKALVALCCK